MDREFIPYELALELKQLGFDEPCFKFYIETGELIPASYSKEGTVYPSNSDLLPEWTASPTYSQAFRWFREKHEIDSAILPTGSTPYQFRLYHKLQDTIKVQLYADYMGKEYKTYEEAEFGCLRAIIKLVKEKQK